MKVACLLLAALAGTGAASALPAAEQALTLPQARELALQHHPRISVAQLRALIAQESVTQVRAARMPLLAANATVVRSGEQVTRIAAGQLSNSQIFDHSGIGATLNVLLTDFGRTASLTEAARQRAKAAAAETVATRAQLLLQVDAAYFDLLKANALRGVATKTLALREAVFARTDALARNQLRSELDVRFAQVSVADARLLMDAAEKDAFAAATTLMTLVGDPGYAGIPELAPVPAPEPLPGDSAALASIALQQRPELARYRAEAEAAKASARAAREARLPTVSLMASAGFIPEDLPQFSDRYAAGGINLNVPLFAGGLYRSRQREAELQASAADAATQDLINTIQREVRLAWLEARHAQERIALTGSLRENADAAMTLARARFEQGLASTVELTQAELALTSAEIAHTTAQFTYRVRRELLDYQTGTLR